MFMYPPPDRRAMYAGYLGNVSNCQDFILLVGILNIHATSVAFFAPKVKHVVCHQVILLQHAQIKALPGRVKPSPGISSDGPFWPMKIHFVVQLVYLHDISVGVSASDHLRWNSSK